MAPARATSWITPRRLRAHGTILALVLWAVYFWNITAPGLRDRAGNLKGTDFLHLYTLGSLALTHRGADLYDMRAQAALVGERVPAAIGVRYLPLYPPQLSIFFAPFARFSYGWALILWLIVSAVLYACCGYVLWRACPSLRDQKSTVVIFIIAFPAFWHLILWGQTSALALVFFTLAFFAFRHEREFLAGLALGCLVFKPQLGVAAALIFVATRRWKVIAGGVLSASAELATALAYYGLGPLREWLNALLHVPTLLPMLEPKLYQTHSLRAFWTLLLPWPGAAVALYIVTAVFVLSLAARCWQSKLSLPLRYSSLLLASVLVAPHLTVYDLIILGPLFLLLSDWCVAHPDDSANPPLELLLYLAYALPLLGPLARWTHVQLTVPVMVAILYLISQLALSSKLNSVTV
jgi:hypothetical protein